jgi:adenylylsulfate kinase
MNPRILIMGLPGSGKTTLATKLAESFPAAVRLNADEVRAEANDWDFSDEGRTRQANRMRDLADAAAPDLVIADFVCGTIDQRDIFRPHLLIWMNTIKKGRYEDTNAAFREPCICGIRIDSFDEIDLQGIVGKINEVVSSGQSNCVCEET